MKKGQFWGIITVLIAILMAVTDSLLSRLVFFIAMVWAEINAYINRKDI